MEPLHAVVKNGRLTLDEPTDLPDGHVVLLLPLDEILALMDGGSDDATEEPGIMFVPAPRSWKSSKPVDARALLDELRAL